MDIFIYGVLLGIFSVIWPFLGYLKYLHYKEMSLRERAGYQALIDELHTVNRKLGDENQELIQRNRSLISDMKMSWPPKKENK